jgi:hypothetical protein
LAANGEEFNMKWYQPKYGGLTHYFKLFGFEIELRIIPKDFKNRLKEITNLIDDIFNGTSSLSPKKVDDMIEDMRRDYGDDPDLVRVQAFADFELGDLVK